MKISKFIIIILSFFVGLFAVNVYIKYKHNHDKGIKEKQDSDAKRLDHDVKLKYRTFIERAEKAKARGNLKQAKEHYHLAGDALERDFEESQSKYIATLLVQFFNDPDIGLQDEKKTLYYTKYIDDKEYNVLLIKTLSKASREGWTLDQDKTTYLCEATNQAVKDQDIVVIASLNRMLKVAHQNSYQVDDCAGRSPEDIDALFFKIVDEKFETLEDNEAVNVIWYMSFFGADRYKYEERIFPKIMERPKYSRQLTSSIMGYINKWGNEERRRQFIHVLEKTDIQTSEILFLRGNYYRSNLVEIPSLKKSRKMYEEALNAGSVKSMLSLFYMQYLGLGGSVDKSAAFETLDGLLKADNPEAKVIDLCLTLSGVRQKAFEDTIDERLNELRWSENGRALNAFAIYWGLMKDRTENDAQLLMEDAALDGSDWGRAGMALFYEKGYGFDRSVETAKIWKNKIGQGGEDIPILSLPIMECTPPTP